MVYPSSLTQSIFLGSLFINSTHIPRVFGGRSDRSPYAAHGPTLHVSVSITETSVPIKDPSPLGISYDSPESVFNNKPSCLANLQRTLGKTIAIHTGADPQNVGVFDCGESRKTPQELMLHINVARSLERFQLEVAKAHKLNTPYYITQSSDANCGPGVDSSSFASSLWIVDSIMQALMVGVDRIYLHQSSGAHNLFGLWGPAKLPASYYGTYLAALALRKATHLVLLQNAYYNHPVYAFYQDQNLIQLLVLNSVYYGNEKNPRPSATVVISGLSTSDNQAQAVSFTAPDASPRKDNEGRPTVGGSSFDDARCQLSPPLKSRPVHINNGVLSVSVRDSEALLITLRMFDLVPRRAK